MVQFIEMNLEGCCLIQGLVSSLGRPRNCHIALPCKDVFFIGK
jgi:hypothetical protein